MTYYDILEISEKASPEVIRMAYKALCKKYHPDVYQGDKTFAEEKMKKLNEAYETLSDETKRKQYDYTINSQAHHTQNTYQAPKQSYYQPKQENRAADIEISLKRGFMALEVGDWIKAALYFERVLNQNAKSAEAYLGKLMIELNVKTKEALKNCSQPFNDKINYQKAYAFADDSLKKFLQETIKFINNRNHETKCRDIYNRACRLMEESASVYDFEDAIAEFEKIRGYKDSAKKIEECYKKIAEINSAILAAEEERKKREEERREKIKAALPLVKKIAIFVVPVLIIAIVAASVLPKIDWNKGNTIDNSSNEITSSNVVVSDTYSNEETSSDTISNNSAPSTNQSSKADTTNSSSASSSEESINSQINSSPYRIFRTENFGYQLLDDGTVKATGYYGDAKTLTIPEKTNGYEVTRVGGEVTNLRSHFFCNASTTSIILPNSIKIIEDYTFAQRHYLTSITIPDSVTYIGESAFAYCLSLNTITLPNNITTISNNLFEGCGVTTLTIPNNVKTIGERAFFACDKLTAVIIPERVETIESEAFLQCYSLSSVVISNSVTILGDYTFGWCKELTSINIPDSVTAIGSNTFYGCSKLKTVYFQSEAQKEKFKHLFSLSVELIVQ